MRIRDHGYAAKAVAWQRATATQLLNLVLPPRCPVNETVVTRQGTLSASAWGRLSHLGPPWCSACGWPFDREDRAETLCLTCTAPSRDAGRLTGRAGLDQIRAALAYSDELAPAVLQLKYADRVDGALAFGRLMAVAGQDLWADRQPILVPVPLHRGRLRKRRYNQAGVLAAAVAKVTGFSHLPVGLTRIKPTPTQKGGSRRERTRNVAGAFSVSERTDFGGQHVVLIDDVLTTGATLLACARPLRKAGAASVSALTLARVIKSAQDPLYAGDAMKDDQ